MANKRKLPETPTHVPAIVVEDWQAAMAALTRIAERVRAAITDMPLQERMKVEWLLEKQEVLWALQVVIESGREVPPYSGSSRDDITAVFASEMYQVSQEQ
jgi:hypothetical protein